MLFIKVYRPQVHKNTNVPLTLKVSEVIFLFCEKHIIGHYSGCFSRTNTMYAEEFSNAIRVFRKSLSFSDAVIVYLHMAILINSSLRTPQKKLFDAKTTGQKIGTYCKM